MLAVTDKILFNYFKLRQIGIDRFMSNPAPFQKRILKRLINENRHTLFGKKHDFGLIRNIEDYRRAVPVNDYNALYPYISQMMEGQPSILSSEEIKWFAKSSGTSTGRSKYIPVSRNYLVNGHIKCAWDAASMIYDEDADAKLFAKKSLIMGGSVEQLDSGLWAGDISGIIIKHFPKIGRRFYTPDFETALMKDWDLKIERMAGICSKEDLTLIAGVPTWLIVLFEAVLDLTGAANISEVWPNLRSFLHGGVNFEPYRKQFADYIPSDKIIYREVFNASEGYFAIQNNKDQEGMLLLCNHEIFYEFLPWSASDKDLSQECLEVHELELGKEYAMVISNTSGLYRYLLGDIVKVVHLNPLKIKVTGRTTAMINVFGEELSVMNVEQALSHICGKHNALIRNYTVGPVYLSSGHKGAHEWYIEFVREPENIEHFAADLDNYLRELNSDYDAKRSKDMALVGLKLRSLPNGSFERWMRQKGRYGGQNKVPRLNNDRKLLEELNGIVHSSD